MEQPKKRQRTQTGANAKFPRSVTPAKHQETLVAGDMQTLVASRPEKQQRNLSRKNPPAYLLGGSSGKRKIVKKDPPIAGQTPLAKLAKKEKTQEQEDPWMDGEEEKTEEGEEEADSRVNEEEDGGATKNAQSSFMADWKREQTEELLKNVGLQGEHLQTLTGLFIPQALRKHCKPGDFSYVEQMVQVITGDESLAKRAARAFVKIFPATCRTFLSNRYPVELCEWNPLGNSCQSTMSSYHRIVDCNGSEKHLDLQSLNLGPRDKTIEVVCGESGSGKSHWALTQGDQDTLTVYCRVTEDISEKEMLEYKNDPAAFCDFMFKKPLLEKLWGKKSVNLVLDEMGPHGNLLSTLCKNGNALWEWAKQNKNVTLKIICVGTGVESLNSAPGSDPSTYNIVRLGDGKTVDGQTIFSRVFNNSILASPNIVKAGHALGKKYPIFEDLVLNMRWCWLLVGCLEEDLNVADKHLSTDTGLMKKFVEQSAASLLQRATFKFKGLNGLESLTAEETSRWCRYAVRLCCRTDPCTDVSDENRKEVMTNLGLVNDNAQLIKTPHYNPKTHDRLDDGVANHVLVLEKGCRRYSMSAANSVIVATLLGEVPILMSNTSGGPLEDFSLSKLMVLLKSMKTNKELIEAFGLKFTGDITDIPSKIVVYHSPHQIAANEDNPTEVLKSCKGDLMAIIKLVRSGKVVLLRNAAGASASDGAILGKNLNVQLQFKDILETTSLHVTAEREKMTGRKGFVRAMKGITGIAKPYVVIMCSSKRKDIVNSDYKLAVGKRTTRLQPRERLITPETGPFLCPSSWPLRTEEEQVKKHVKVPQSVETAQKAKNE